MSEVKEKIFVGSAKVIPTKYGELTKVTFHKDNINTMVQYMKTNQSDFINLVVKEKQNKVEGKPTHYLEVDEWKPDAQQNNPAPSSDSKPVNYNPSAGGEDILPF